jgi:hypothetical protein
MSKAGSAKSESFNLGAATVMIGPKEKVLDLTPEEHSLGLVKNFTFSANDQYLDLTQGVRNTVVYSVKTGSEITASMEVYEYTAKNLAYALGLEGYDLVEGVDMTLNTAITGASSTASIEAIAPKGATADDIVVGDYVTIQGNKSSNEDLVFVGKAATVSFREESAPELGTDATIGQMIKAINAQREGLLTTNMGKLTINCGSTERISMSPNFATAFGFTGETEDGMIKVAQNGSVTGTVSISRNNKLSTVNLNADGTEIEIAIDAVKVAAVTVKANPSTNTSAKFEITFDRAIPEGFKFGVGDRVHKANLIPVGSAEAQPTLGAKVVGILPEGNKPITIIIPKLRITNGFSVGFQTDQYGNMPYEFTPFEQIPSDPLYAEYGDKGFAFILE